MLEFTKLVSEYQNCVFDIKCPTLIIHGINDLVVPSESTVYVYNSIKSKTNILYNIKNLQHDCFTVERSKEVKSIIKDFLIKHPKKKKEIINI